MIILHLLAAFLRLEEVMEGRKSQNLSLHVFEPRIYNAVHCSIMLHQEPKAFFKRFYYRKY